MGVPPTIRRECPPFPAPGRFPNEFAQGNRSALIQNQHTRDPLGSQFGDIVNGLTQF